MIREILIMQHGNVKRGYEKNDLAFELKDKGKRNAQRIGIWLATNNLSPDYIICSAAEYVKTTMEKTCKAAGFNAKNIKLNTHAHNASDADIIDAIKGCPEKAKCILIVGHDDALENVLSDLSKTTIPKNKKDKVLSPAALVHFQIDCAWSEISAHCAELKNVIYPKKLPEFFPYPDIHGNENRIRPAYYYRQSAVIPYRVEKDKTEVLIISSSTDKHWLIPKGIHEPGLSAQESASNEAYEEAGVTGQISEAEIGCYKYEKWEGVCAVSVFIMRVSSMLNEDQWKESQRERRWVAVQEAVKLIHNNDLANIIATLPKYLEQVAA